MRYLVVERDGRPIIELVELRVALRERIGAHTLSPGARLVDIALELREERLTKERAPELLTEVVQKVRTLGCILGVVQKVAQKQALVGRGGDLRHEHLVLRVAARLRLAREVGVQGVAGLVDEREDVV